MNKGKIVAAVLSVIMAVAFLTGCGGVSVKQDLINYDKNAAKVVNKMKDSDASKVDDFMSKLKDMNKELDNLDIKTDDVKKLNKQLVKGFDELIGAYGDLQKAQKNNDLKLATKAQSEATKAQKDLEKFSENMKALAKKENVTLKLKSVN